MRGAGVGSPGGAATEGVVADDFARVAHAGVFSVDGGVDEDCVAGDPAASQRTWAIGRRRYPGDDAIATVKRFGLANI